MTSDPRARRGPRKRALGAVVAVVLLVAGFAVATTRTASAAPQTVTAGALDWGVKASFRSYVTGPIAHGSITLDDGATQNADGTFHFPASTSATYDAASGSPAATFGGTVRFQGHDGLLDMTIRNIRVRHTGTTGTLIADVVTVPFQGTTPPAPPAETYTGVELATLSGGTSSTTATSATWSGAAVVLTTAGAPAFGGFYAAGDALDPASFSLTLQETTTPPTPGPATGALVWKLSNQAWSASSLAPSKAAGAPAVLGSDAWGFPASGAVTFDPATKATELNLGGSLTIGNTAQGNYRIVLANPSIQVDAAGAGALRADVSTCTTACGTADEVYSTPTRVVVVDFTLPDASVTDTGSHVSWTVTPDYPLQGNATWPTFGQFPQSFLDALPASLQGHFKDSASGTPPAPAAANANKPPAPLEVSFDYTAVMPGPTGVVQNITTEVLENGGLTISVADDTVVLPTSTLSPDGTTLLTSGAINPVTVTDLRLANPGWNAHGQVSDFTGTGGAIDGSRLGWTPNIVSAAATQTVTAGGAVTPGVGSGLKPSSVLGSASAGAGRGTAVLGAGLELRAPTTTPPGTYNAVLTLTVI